MDIIRIDLLNLLAHVPGIGNLDFVVARAINIAEPPGMKKNNVITVQKRTRLNIFVRSDNAIYLIRKIIRYYQYRLCHFLASMLQFPMYHHDVQPGRYNFLPSRRHSYK